MIRIKCRVEGQELRRFSIPVPEPPAHLTIEDLRRAVVENFPSVQFGTAETRSGNGVQSVGVPQIPLRFKDDEGDLCALEHDGDLQEALALSPKLLRLQVGTPNDNAARDDETSETATALSSLSVTDKDNAGVQASNAAASRVEKRRARAAAGVSAQKKRKGVTEGGIPAEFLPSENFRPPIDIYVEDGALPSEYERTQNRPLGHPISFLYPLWRVSSLKHQLAYFTSPENRQRSFPPSMPLDPLGKALYAGYLRLVSRSLEENPNRTVVPRIAFSLQALEDYTDQATRALVSAKASEDCVEMVVTMLRLLLTDRLCLEYIAQLEHGSRAAAPTATKAVGVRDRGEPSSTAPSGLNDGSNRAKKLATGRGSDNLDETGAPEPPETPSFARMYKPLARLLLEISTPEAAASRDALARVFREHPDERRCVIQGRRDYRCQCMKFLQAYMAEHGEWDVVDIACRKVVSIVMEEITRKNEASEDTVAAIGQFVQNMLRDPAVCKMLRRIVIKHMSEKQRSELGYVGGNEGWQSLVPSSRAFHDKDRERRRVTRGGPFVEMTTYAASMQVHAVLHHVRSKIARNPAEKTKIFRVRALLRQRARKFVIDDLKCDGRLAPSEVATSVLYADIKKILEDAGVSEPTAADAAELARALAEDSEARAIAVRHIRSEQQASSSAVTKSASAGSAREQTPSTSEA